MTMECFRQMQWFSFPRKDIQKQIKDKLLTTFAYNDMCQDDKGNIILAKLSGRRQLHPYYRHRKVLVEVRL